MIASDGRRPRVDHARIELWMRAARRGEEGAVAALYALLHEPLARYVRRRASTWIRRWVDPEEIAHGVLAGAFCWPDRFPEDLTATELVARLRQTALWRIKDAARRHGRDLGESVLLRLPSRATATPSDTPAAEGPERTDGGALRELIQSLPPKYREVVEMRLDGHSFESVGRALGLAPDAARMRFRRAVERMRLRASVRRQR